MTTANIISFKDYVLSQNTYLGKGFAVAFKDEQTKKVYCRDGTELTPVMPNDTLGDYFYIRYERGVKFSTDLNGRIADCAELGLAFNDEMQVVLVVCVRDADEFTLLNNIRLTCSKFPTFKAVPVGATLIRELVVANEMAGAEKDDLLAALQRLGNWTVISVNINLNSQYLPTNCITNPCKTC